MAPVSSLTTPLIKTMHVMNKYRNWDEATGVHRGHCSMALLRDKIYLNLQKNSEKSQLAPLDF